ncbi:polyketide synthase dehydratase domain-containing protein, partial [Bacillus cereus group sp. TH177-1LC]
LWISGEDISAWEELYEETPYRVTLPTYPFEETKYWVERKRDLQKVSHLTETVTLTGLIDSHESTPDVEIYRKCLKRDEFYLQDHIVNGQIILPGVVYLEMARMAGTLASSHQDVVRLENIVWTQPIKILEETKDILLTLNSKEERHTYNICIGEKTVCSQGDIIYGTLKGVETEWMNIDKIQRNFHQKIERQSLYPLFEKAGFMYGESFKP